MKIKGPSARDKRVQIYVKRHERDISLLRFMADRAVETAQLPTAAAAAARSHKTAQIDKMARLTTSRGCFRESLVGYFTGPKRVARRSFSTWLLELVFADRAVRQQKVICCDACQQRLILRWGPIAFVRKVLGLRHKEMLAAIRGDKYESSPEDIVDFVAKANASKR